MTERQEEVPAEDVVRVPEDDDDNGDELRREIESEGEVAKAEVTPNGDEGGAGPLLADKDTGGFRSRWNEIQVRFVDEPRDSVKKADSLVAEMMERLSQMFSEERTRLEDQWERGDDISTEDLRIALQRYRSFFNRLLSA
jgi:hypothetical protein